MRGKMTVFLVLLALCAAVACFGQEGELAETHKNPFTLFFPLGYDLIKLADQTVHSPAGGAGFMIGEQDLPFTEVERRFFALALYQPFIFTNSPGPDMPELYHEISGLFDGRIKRHQLLFILKSSSDKPIAGGLHTFQIGAGWGYEVIRKQHVSLILGAALAVSDFGMTLPSGAVWPVLPLPLVRFGIDAKWFASSFDFLTGPNFDFTVAPQSKFRLTGETRMDNYRSLDGLICEFTLWYRLFDSENKLGDFAGIGVGFKNDVKEFDLSKNSGRAESFALLERAVFAAIDLSILRIQGGWAFDSYYLLDGERNGGPGRGFFISVQGMVPISIR